VTVKLRELTTNQGSGWLDWVGVFPGGVFDCREPDRDSLEYRFAQ